MEVQALTSSWVILRRASASLPCQQILLVTKHHEIPSNKPEVTFRWLLTLQFVPTEFDEKEHKHRGKSAHPVFVRASHPHVSLLQNLLFFVQPLHLVMKVNFVHSFG